MWTLISRCLLFSYHLNNYFLTVKRRSGIVKNRSAGDLLVIQRSCRWIQGTMLIPRYTKFRLFLGIISTVILVVIIFPNNTKEVFNSKIRHAMHRIISSVELSFETLKQRNFTDAEINKMSTTGRWLLLSEESSSPPIIRAKKDPYLILIWKHGVFLERRHIKRFTNNRYSPWENCTVSNCALSYRSDDLHKADAVVFHLHQTKSTLELPIRTRMDQIWIFLTDESPIHTFLYGNQKLSDYNGFFNWSMSYRMDSDVPVPYGRAILKAASNSDNSNLLEESIKKQKTKLVAIMGSNCGGKNDRWNYVKELKSLLGNDLDIYGRCLGGNTTACPGHFDKDCFALNVYKFYLAFENSNCKEYLTEKIFWHGYHKLAIPIIMGAPKKDCERLLPPKSFLHVSDFANPSALADYIQYLNRHDNKYMEFHTWRRYYRVLNEHGYFGSVSRHYCRICEALHYNSPVDRIYHDLESFWSERDCSL